MDLANVKNNFLVLYCSTIGEKSDAGHFCTKN